MEIGILILYLAGVAYFMKAFKDGGISLVKAWSWHIIGLYVFARLIICIARKCVETFRKTKRGGRRTD